MKIRPINLLATVIAVLAGQCWATTGTALPLAHRHHPRCAATATVRPRIT